MSGQKPLFHTGAGGLEKLASWQGTIVLRASGEGTKVTSWKCDIMDM
jgi:hypothetical protein